MDSPSSISLATITPEAVEALERLGVAEAVNALGELLRSADGLNKHGEQGWRHRTNDELAGKLLGHIPSPALVGLVEDGDSEQLAILHALSRALMLAQRGVESREQGFGSSGARSERSPAH